MRIPEAQGLYNPGNEHDNCGIGFVAHIKGKPSHEIIQRGLDVLLNMDHRGAKSADNSTGDGAGLLMQIPHDFITGELRFDVGEPGKYGTGLVFLPKEESEADICMEVLNRNIAAEGLKLVGWRDVPVDHTAPGQIAKTTEPAIKQVFVKANLEKDALERKLYIVRKLTEKEIRDSNLVHKRSFYQPSFSAKIMVYKGMFTPQQLKDYFLDFNNEQFKSAIALVHSRFSTNTSPPGIWLNLSALWPTTAKSIQSAETVSGCRPAKH
jgi:glutamate synthase (NADPH/NADH) large chain